MARTVATIRGVALRPGISRNGRYYTPELITRAVDRANERIAEGLAPLTMMTCHAAAEGGPATEVCGRLTELTVAEDGSAHYVAAIAGNQAGRDILELIDTSDGKAPFLKGVSIRGDWCEDPRLTYVDGQRAITADDMEIDGLDFTHRPGVVGAEVTTVELLADTTTREQAAHPRRITESVQEARVSIDEEAAPPATPGDIPFVGDQVTSVPSLWADNGYIGGEKRYPLDDLDQARAAFGLLGESTVRRQYSAAQLKRMDGRVRKALEGHGVEVDRTNGWMIISGEDRETTNRHVTEYYGSDHDRCGSVYVSIDNGKFSVSVNSFKGIDPHDLDKVARAAMSGACLAMAELDLEADGQDDSVGKPMKAKPSDADLSESAPIPSPTNPVADTQAPSGVTPNTDEEAPAVSEPTTNSAVTSTPAATTPASPALIALTPDQFNALLATVTGQPAPATKATVETAAPVVPADAPPVVETAPNASAENITAPNQVAESDEQRINRLVAEGIQTQTALIMQAVAQNGALPTRKGFVQGGSVTETTTPTAAGTSAYGYPEGWPDKPLHEYTQDEFRQHVTPNTGRAILGDRLEAN